jgi:hypothetical protein
MAVQIGKSFNSVQSISVPSVWPSIGLQNLVVPLQFKIMRFKIVFTLVFPLIIAWTALWTNPAQAQSAENLFTNGVLSHQKGDLAGAKRSFQESLKLDPDNAITIFNLALTEYQQGNAGLALALWRKALALHPSERSSGRAIEWAKAKLERPEIPHEVQYWESLRQSLLLPVSVEVYIAFSAALLLLSGWVILGFFGKRRRAMAAEIPMPHLSKMAILSGIAFILVASLTLAKLIDLQDLRGTIVAKKVEARSTPETTGTSLFELYEGLEVIVRQARNDWVQVSFPGGLTGWIPRSSIFTTRDEVVR